MAKILIVDDTRLNAELLEAHLEGHDHEIRLATNGEEALALAKADVPDVILLDVMMPKLSGFEVCQRLRANSATARIGILMITALDQSTDIERAIEAGTDDFLTRPVNKTELLIRTHALLDAVKQADPSQRALTYYRGILHGATA